MLAIQILLLKTDKLLSSIIENISSLINFSSDISFNLKRFRDLKKKIYELNKKINIV